MRQFNETQGDLMRLFQIEFLQFLLGNLRSNVQIERTWKDSPRAYICCRAEKFARPFITNELFERIQILNERKFHR